MGQWGEFRVKNANFIFKHTFFLYTFFIKKFDFIIFYFFFLGSVKFLRQILGNQSETKISDKKLSVELHNYYSKQRSMMFSLFKEVLKYSAL